jgi:protocatechuate 3,4-dioxygenase beta subunit
MADRPPPAPGSALVRDLARVIDRRRALGLVAAGLGGAMASACSGRAVAAADGAACLPTPIEIKGPFPADGSNGRPRPVNVLDLADVVRRDIRPSFAGLAGRADGVPLDLTLTLVDQSGCTPLAGHALYLWQNDAAGEYSLYTMPQANYLRGMQAADAAGQVRFTTIVPGCYGGRTPHCHLEVYASLAAARSGAPPLLVSQLAFPDAPCRAIYTTDSRYGASLANLDRWPIPRDFVFADGSPEIQAAQTVAMAGAPATGFSGTATITL